MQLSENKNSCRLLSGQFGQGQRNTLVTSSFPFSLTKGEIQTNTYSVFVSKLLYGVKWPVAYTDRTYFPAENLLKKQQKQNKTNKPVCIKFAGKFSPLFNITQK